MSIEHKPFRFWCQKVLPLVYDDSLSYYELLGKVVDYLNKMGQDISDLSTYLDDYITNFDVEAAVDAKLDAMVESGYFDRLMIPIFNEYKDNFELSFSSYQEQTNIRLNQQSGQISSLQTQVDQLGSLEDGSTTGDAELTGIRSDYRGRVFASAGDSVRTNEEDLNFIANEALVTDGGISFTYVADSYITTQGVITADASTHWQRTDYIPVSGVDGIYIYQSGGEANSAYNAFYTENKVFISNFYTAPGENLRAIPATARYMILSNSPGVTYVVTKHKLVDNEYWYGKGIDENSRSILPVYGWKQGSIGTAGFTRIHTDKIPILGHERFLVRYDSALYQVAYQTYAQDGTLIYDSTYFTADAAFTTANSARWIAFLAKKSDDSYIYPSDMVNAKIAVTLDQTDNVNTNRLRIMSFNVGGFDYGTGQGLPIANYDEKVANWKQFIMKQKCDIMCVQEYYDYLNKAHTVSAGSTLFDPIFIYNTRGYQNVIEYSKMPALQYTDDQYLGAADAGTKRGYTVTHHMINHKLVCVVNVHLWYVEADTEVRAAQISDLLTVIANEKYVVICGDFNAASQSEYDAFVNAGYTLCNGGYAGWHYTWHANPEHTGTKFYSDNVITSANIICENFEVLDVFDDLTSDHKPIVADLIID